MKHPEILQLFSEFVRIPSISAQPQRFGDMLTAVQLLVDRLKELGFMVELVGAGEGIPPLLKAVRPGRAGAPVIGIYGHYDVQPEDPIDQWKTPPFTLSILDGKIWGRGVADNKGHIVQNIAAIAQLIEENMLHNTIVFVLEGEEETGSGHFETCINQVKEELETVDVFYVTDMGMHGSSKPQIFYALRGILYCELTVRTGVRDLHSGVYGNRVYNPAQILAGVLARMKDDKSDKIRIPHFYDKVRKMPLSELKMLTKTKVSDQSLLHEAGVYGVRSSPSSPAYLRAKIHPSFEINGMTSGYTGEGSKTIIPHTATAKFSFRLIEYQDPVALEKRVHRFIKAYIPKGIPFELKQSASSAPFYTSLDNPYVKRTEQIFKEVFKTETLFNRSGGTVGAAEILQRVLKKPVILTGFTLPDDNIHSPNENFDEEMFWMGIKALHNIYSASF